MNATETRDPILEGFYRDIESKSQEVTRLFDAEDEAIKKDPAFKMSAEDVARVKDLNKAIESLEHQAKDREESQGIRRSAQERLTAMTKATTRPPLPQGGDPRERQEQVKSVGQEFLDSAEFKAWLRSVAPSGHINENAKGLQSPSVPLGINLKTLVTGASATSAGAFVFHDFKPLVELPFRPISILDLITGGETQSDTIEYPQVTGYTNAAANVAEATATGDGSGAKPESALALQRVTTAVRTIAHWIPATKRALSDAGQMRTLIDAFLREGLRQRLADQVVTGNGVGDNLLGIVNQTGLTLQAFDTDILVTTRKARTKVRTVGRAVPTGYVLNPTDWETIDLLKDNEARYYFGGPSVLGTPRLWGLPVAEEEALTAATGLVGDIRQAVLWDREQASIQVSDSHSDFFIRNMVAILAEMRAAFGVLRPAAIVKITLA